MPKWLLDVLWAMRTIEDNSSNINHITFLLHMKESNFCEDIEGGLPIRWKHTMDTFGMTLTLTHVRVTLMILWWIQIMASHNLHLNLSEWHPERIKEATLSATTSWPQGMSSRDMPILPSSSLLNTPTVSATRNTWTSRGLPGVAYVRAP